jgi:hypothetical protein
MITKIFEEVEFESTRPQRTFVGHVSVISNLVLGH